MLNSGYTFKVKEGGNKLMSFCIENEKLLEIYKAISIKIGDLKNVELNALLVHDNRYIKIKIRTCGDKVYTDFRGLHVPEDDIEYESFTVISFDSLLVYDKKHHLQVFAYKILDKQITDYLDENLFED